MNMPFICSHVLLLLLTTEFLLLFQQSQQLWICVAVSSASLPPSRPGPREHSRLEGWGKSQMMGLSLT